MVFRVSHFELGEPPHRERGVLFEGDIFSGKMAKIAQILVMYSLCLAISPASSILFLHLRDSGPDL